MPAKDFKSGFKANSLKGRKISGEDSTVPFGANPVREELERQAGELPITEIAITRLLDNPYQHLARPQLDENNLEELASSIAQNGFYGALLARRKKNSDDQLELAFGHRRKEAARRAGLLSLPVKVLNLTDVQMVRIMASENFSRQNLDPLGEANVIGLLESNQNLSARQISEIVGQGRSWVERRLALYRAPEDLKEMVSQKPETFSLVDVLISVTDSKLRHNLIEEVLTNNLTRRQVQERLLRPDSSSPASSTTSSLIERATSRVDPSLVSSTSNGPDRPDSESENVKEITIPPQKGNGENYNNLSEISSFKEEWLEGIDLIDKGVGKLVALSGTSGRMPGEAREKISISLKQLNRMLRNR